MSKRKSRPSADDDRDSSRCISCLKWFVPRRSSHRCCSRQCSDRVRKLRTRYGLSPEDYRRMEEDNKGRCPICRRPVTRFVVDHDHRTGKTTGLVCNSCNVGALATTYHDPSFISTLLDYVLYPPADRLGVVATAGSPEPSSLEKLWRKEA